LWRYTDTLRDLRSEEAELTGSDTSETRDLVSSFVAPQMIFKLIGHSHKISQLLRCISWIALLRLTFTVFSEEIYKEFFTSKSQGTGMSLPISRSIIESHGGRLWAILNSARGCNI